MDQQRDLGRAGTNEAVNLTLNGQQALDGTQAENLGGADMLKMYLNGNGGQVPTSQGGRGCGRTPEEGADSFGHSLRQPGILFASAGSNINSRKAMVPYHGGEDAAARI